MFISYFIIKNIMGLHPGLKYGAAACTVIAGILHLMLVQPMLNFNNVNTAVFFLISGIAQIFWA